MEGSPIELAKKVREYAMKHNAWFKDSLPMIASENVMSPLAMEMLLTDFGHRYAEGHPGKRYYQGCKIYDEVEIIAIEAMKKLFNANYVDVRPVSGTAANLAAIRAMVKPGMKVASAEVPAGAHISHQEFGSVGVRGAEVIHYPFDNHELIPDVDGVNKLIEKEKPALIIFGYSLFLFPIPLKEIAPTAEANGTRILYDAAHVLGLIAGKKFQDPLREGATVMTGSTHKTFPGPQKGVVIANIDESDEAQKKLKRKLDSAVFPGVTSNHHLHHVAALAITALEMLEFGEEYATQVVKNAKALGQYMTEEGFKVLGEHKGFTESHQIAVDVRELGGGAKAAQMLEDANIIVNANLLPGDRLEQSMNPSGIRIGVQELTRIGMKEKDMQVVAELFKRVLIDKEDPKKVAEDVKEFKAQFKEVHYCFKVKEFRPYEYIKLVELQE
ncbi:MAG: serine hydroxymethyltransferase [Euryarchaeota archaeon]|nr:serine hydroxymethyltransferase [Euryarchaeota archaeon]